MPPKKRPSTTNARDAKRPSRDALPTEDGNILLLAQDEHGKVARYIFRMSAVGDDFFALWNIITRNPDRYEPLIIQICHRLGILSADGSNIHAYWHENPIPHTRPTGLIIRNILAVMNVMI